MMTNHTRQVAMFRHKDREKLMPIVKQAMDLFAKESGVDLFPPTLRQVALFLRYGRKQVKADSVVKKAYESLISGIEKSLTYRQGKSILGMSADPEVENWKSMAGREAAEMLQNLRIY